jgi:putative ABC transport system ATP-binding protein
MTTPVIEAVDVGKFLGSGPGRVEALKGITLSLVGGELTLLMGPSGSGKTTLLSILGCMLSPTTGTVRILGRSTAGALPEQLAELRREHVGFIFQSYHLFPTLTAVENVRLALDVCGNRSSLAADKARAALEAVGLATKTRAFPRELSSGEQQRVAIARAIINEPKILLADEPTGNLDTKNSDIVLEMLRRLNKDLGQTIVMITHNPEATTYFDRVVHMRDGVIVDGIPAD